MKVLLSAYACEPGKGSEPGMGWHWAVEIARRGHEVHVLTRANNVGAIRNGLAALGGLHIEVHGYDLPRWARWWKKGQRGVRSYYLLWQWGAYRLARRLHPQHHFDVVHHITFAVYRHPSFMGRLGIPFIFGPIGGGEYAPLSLFRTAPWQAKVSEFLRWASNKIAATDPLVRDTFRRAAVILYKTRETLAVVPRAERDKCVQVQDVAVDPAQLVGLPSGTEGPRFFYAGRLLHWKGVHLILAALKELRSNVPDVVVTIAGDGRDRDWLRTRARQLGVDHAVKWCGKLPRDQVIALHNCHTAFVFPSLHDSGGTVIMEALSQGVPVICLNLAGPGAMLPADCGIKIDVHGRTEAQVITALAQAMYLLAIDTGYRAELAVHALAAARRLTWSAVVSRAYEKIEEVVAAR